MILAGMCICGSLYHLSFVCLCYIFNTSVAVVFQHDGCGNVWQIVSMQHGRGIPPTPSEDSWLGQSA